MLTRILVPLDGSALAEHALLVAAYLARATSGTLLLLQVYQSMPGEFVPELVVQESTADEREARAYLAGLRERSDLRKLEVETLALSGAVARTILDAVEAFHADTIVMSSHGRSGVTRWMLGSVAEHVVRHAPVPILVLRGREHELIVTRLAGAALCACVGLDGSALAERAIEPAVQLLRALAGPDPAEIRFVRVLKAPVSTDDESAAGANHERRVAEALAGLQRIAERLRTGDLARYDVRARWSVVEAADIADALISAAEHPELIQWHMWHTTGAGEVIPAPAPQCAGMHFIALATHGRGGLQRWALGSIAERVLENTSLPLLLVRPSPVPALSTVAITPVAQIDA